MFISFEGPDGSGKTTALKTLVTYLEKKQVKYILTREPGTPHLKISEQIRSIIMETKRLSPMVEAILFAADRRIHLEQIIWPALQAKKLVLCDRYFDSSVAYQGNARNLGMAEILKLNEIISENTYPHLTIYFDLPYQEANKRVENRGEKNRLDTETIEFVKKVHQGYQYLIKKHPHRFRVIDATKSPQAVFEDVKKIFEEEILK